MDRTPLIRSHVLLCAPVLLLEARCKREHAWPDRTVLPLENGIQNMTRKDIEHTMYSLNHRLGKCLNFKTPYEVFMKQLHLQKSMVALQN